MSGNWASFARESKSGGWRALICAAVGYGLGVSVLPYYTLGAFVRPLETSFGWSRAEVQGCMVSVIVGTLLAASIWGWLTDRYGVRKVGISSQIGLAMTLLLLGLNPGHLWYWYGGWFVMTVLGLGTSPVTWTRSVVTWFNEGRGFALAIALCGSGVSSVVMPTAAAFAIEHIGWRLAYAMLAGSVLLVALPVTIWVLPRDDRPDLAAASAPTENLEGLTVGEAMKDVRFWMLTLSLMMVGFAVSGMIPNLVPMMIGRGIEATTAATFMGVLGMSLIAGRLVTGAALDRFWAPLVALVLLPLPAMACLLLETGISAYLAVAGCIALIGIATGAEFDLAPYMVTRYFGTRSYSQIYALQWIAFTVAAGAAPLLYGYLYDLFGNYSVPLYVSAALFLLAPFVLLGLGRYPVFGRVEGASQNALSPAGG